MLGACNGAVIAMGGHAMGRIGVGYDGLLCRSGTL